MSDLRVPSVARSQLGLLLRVKACAMRNRLRQAVNDSPVRLLVALILILLIWFGLYELFHAVFQQLRRTPLEATVAIPLVFNFFFVAMLVLLTLSNTIIAYGALFGKSESAYLLASPLTALDVVTLKYIESQVLASWALVVLGFPLMMAMADFADNPVFYLLFVAFFLAFIPIPAGLGLLLAWATARFMPRRSIRAVLVGMGAVTLAWVLYSLHSLARMGESATQIWLRSFLGKMSFVEGAFLPNHWVAAGIDHALDNQLSESLLYLGVTTANAFFVGWLVVTIVSRNLDVAQDRVASGRALGRRSASRASGGFCGLAFFYLPLPLRLIAAKDLRTFFRDPVQWSQLVILFGLLALYLTNTPTLRLRASGWGWGQLIPFLNLCAISFILATFTCRFVFPLVSLEGQKLWLVGLLPMPRGHLLLAKFAFALTVTLLVAIGAMGLATYMLRLPVFWVAIHLAVTAAVCFGLCGFAVGIGARLPMFSETNTARIANGLGGTVNLIASVALITVVLTGVGLATFRTRWLPEGTPPDLSSLGLCLVAILVGVAAGVYALRIGTRHIDRLEV